MAGKPPRAYRAVLTFLRLLVRAFFRRVIVTGREHIPADRGGIVVSWHPNGLIDPGLVLTQFPRQVVFGARNGVFKYPLLGTLMRSIGTVPIYRAMDKSALSDEERSARNKQSLAALAGEIARGSFSALFPEGLSHDAPHLHEIKSGAARLFYQARAMQSDDQRPAVIVPVGLHYDDKDLFRSNALVEFFPPVELPESLAFHPDLPEDERRRRIRDLTKEIERILHDVVLATESWELHRLMHRARKLIRAERASRAGADPGRTTMNERVLGFARIRLAYDELLQTHPEQVAELVARVDEYDADMRALAVEDHELDRAPKLASLSLVTLLLLQVVTVFLLLPPVLLIGWVVNAPAALLLIAVSKAVSRHKKDEATVKLLLGALLFPLTWAAAGALTAYAHHYVHAAIPNIPDTPVLAGVLVALLSAIGGAVAVRYLGMARETARAVRVRLTRTLRRRNLERLRQERSDLTDALLEISSGIELPGDLLPDGRVVKDGKSSAHISVEVDEHDLP